jgi:urease accessory protein
LDCRSIGGPVSAGKTTLTEQRCRALATRRFMAVITKDIYIRENADFWSARRSCPASASRAWKPGATHIRAPRFLTVFAATA